jgi:hypothetical protein
MELRTGRLAAATFGIDTSFIFFFLALDFGAAAVGYGLDALVSGICLFALMTLPYFLGEPDDRMPFASWIRGRLAIGAAGILLGGGFGMAAGTILPDAARLIPTGLLIAVIAFSFYVQFFRFLKLRLVK